MGWENDFIFTNLQKFISVHSVDKYLADMLNQMLRVGFVIFFLALLTACSHYEYYPPKSAAGRQCTVQCSAVREMCISNENNHAQYERASCERRSHATYERCMRRAEDKDDAKACARAQPVCYTSANTYRCEDNYRACYVNCGGQVRLVDD